MEKQLQDQLVEQLVSQFSKEEYASYVKDLKEKREKEARRVEQKVHKIESLLTAGKFEDALKLCGEERDGLQLEEPWLTLEGKVMAAFNPTFHVREQNPSSCWGFAHRSSLHSRFRRVGSFA